MDLNKLRAKRVALLQEFFSTQNYGGLKKLYDSCAEDALVYEDDVLINVAVLAYAFTKLLPKKYVVESKEWKTHRFFVAQNLRKASNFFKKNAEREGAELLASVVKETENLSLSLGRFVKSAVEKARVKVGSQMYAHGASLGKAAALSKSEKKDLADYVGATKLVEKYSTLSVKERLAKALDLLK